MKIRRINIRFGLGLISFVLLLGVVYWSFYGFSRERNNMTIGPAPDWTDVTWLVGNFEGVPTLIAVDVDGNIVVPMMGMTDDGLAVVALDEGNRIIAVIQDPVTENYIGINDAGEITCVFKGMGPAGLITLKADADGRLIAILTDPEDVWGVFKAMGFAEMAAILSPAKRFDSRGHILWLMDFEHGLQGLNSNSDHSDSTVKLTSDRSNFGAFSLKLDPRASANSFVRVWRLLTPMVLSNMGMECWVTSDSYLYYIYWNLYKYDGTNYWLARLRYEHSSGDWAIYVPGPDYEPILEGKKIQTGSGAWTAVKLVADFVDHTYLRVLIGDEYVDISAHALFTDSSGSVAQIETRVQVDGDAAQRGPAYFDSWIVTTKEPENPE